MRPPTSLPHARSRSTRRNVLGSQHLTAERWSARYAASLFEPLDAAMMSPKEHAEAVRSLARCDATVADQNGQQFLWRVERSAMPSLPSEGCWYLYFGGSALPTALKALVKRPDGQPVGATSPKSSGLFSYTSKRPERTAVPWHNKSPHLVTPALKAIVPRDRVLHVQWSPEARRSSASTRRPAAPGAATPSRAHGYVPRDRGPARSAGPVPAHGDLRLPRAAVRL